MSGFFYPLAAEEPVAPGATWRPESAARYNALTDLLNQFSLEPRGDLATPTAPCLKVCGINVSAQELLPGTPVEFAQIGTAAAGLPHSPWGQMRPATDSSEFWGITVSAIPVGGYGDVVLNGLLWCTPQGTPNSCVEVKSGQLVYTDSGRGKVLQITPENEALIYLPDNSNTYDGPLKVILDSDNPLNLLLVDGAYPDRQYAGHIYCNGVKHLVKRQTIPAEDGILCISCMAANRAEPKLAYETGADHFPNTDQADALAYYPLAEIEMIKSDTAPEPAPAAAPAAPPPSEEPPKFKIRQLVRYTYPELWVAGPCDTNQQGTK